MCVLPCVLFDFYPVSGMLVKRASKLKEKKFLSILLNSLTLTLPNTTELSLIWLLLP